MKESIPTKITLTDFQKNTPSFVSNINGHTVSPYLTAKRIAQALFKEHKCYEYGITEAGIVGIRSDETTVLLERNTLEQYVLSCFTDLTMRYMTGELAGLIQDHNAKIYRERREQTEARIAAEKDEKERKINEAYSKICRFNVLVSGTKDEITTVQRNIDEASESYEAYKKHTIPEGALTPPSELSNTTKAFADRLKDLKEQHKSLQKRLAEQEKELLASQKEYEMLSGKPIFD